MNTERLLPPEVLDYTAHLHYASISRQSHLIYAAVISFTLAAMASLPFIYVDVSVKSPGALRASAELTTLRATANGRIHKVNVSENAVVPKGTLLISIVSPVLVEKEKYFTAKTAETSMLAEDLGTLLSFKKIPGNMIFQSDLYQQAYDDFLYKLNERHVRCNKVTQDFNRSKKLHDERVIADADFENTKFELDKAESEIAQFRESQLHQWQQELRTTRRDLQEFQTQLSQVRKEMENLNVVAPVSGTIQNLRGIYPGSQVYPNEELADISPDTTLIAEVYVSPNDIGLIQKGMSARFQVSAFNYNYWGMLSGNVFEIPDDASIRDGKPIFEIKCTVDRAFLTLKNGRKGELKKGMTLQCNFLVTERSLWQLLYDKADDWLNPTRISYPFS